MDHIDSKSMQPSETLGLLANLLNFLTRKEEKGMKKATKHPGGT